MRHHYNNTHVGEAYEPTTYPLRRQAIPPSAANIDEEYFNTSPLDRVYAKSGKHLAPLRVPRSALQDFKDVYKIVLENIADCMEHTSDNDGEALQLAVEAYACLPRLLMNRLGVALRPEACRRLFNKLATSNDTAREVIALFQRHQELTYNAESLPRARKGLSENHLKLAEARACKKVEIYVKKGRPSKALQYLESWENRVTISPTDVKLPANAQMVRNLHPEASAEDRLPSHNLAESHFSISEQDLAKAIQALPSMSAAGMSGWTYDLIKYIHLADDTTTLSLLKVYNLILEGKGGDPSFWTLSRMVPIAKPNGSFRPLAVGEVPLRVLSRAVSMVKTNELGPTLAPLQYGAGVSGGAEIIIHACQMTANFMKERDEHTRSEEQEDPEDPAFDPTCIGMVDYSNAFNTLFRLRIHEGLVSYAPELIPYFTWAYGSPSPLLLADGYRICDSETGIRQGDPLGPLYFSLGTFKTLQDLKRDFPNVEAFAYLDDITLIGSRSDVVQAIGWLHNKSPAAGLHVNFSKTYVWDSTRNSDATIREINYVHNGLLALGGPIGGGFQSCGISNEAGFNEKYADCEMTNAAEVLPKLELLRKFTAILLARVCVNSRSMYLTRVLPPGVTLEAGVKFDAKMDTCLATAAGYAARLPEVSQLVRGLPTSDGGMSMRRVRDARECSFAASFISVAQHMSQQHRAIWDRFTSSESTYKDHITSLLNDSVPDFSSIEDSGIKYERSVDADDEERAADQHAGRGLSSKGKHLQKQAKRKQAMEAADANVTAFTEHARLLAEAMGGAALGGDDEPLDQPDHIDHSQRGLQARKDTQTVELVSSMLAGAKNKLAFF